MRPAAATKKQMQLSLSAWPKASRAIASPRPVPLFALGSQFGSFTRKNGWKICCSNSPGTPGPLSRTERTACDDELIFSVFKITSTSLPGEVNLIALRTIFSHALRKACCSAFSMTISASACSLTDLPKERASKSPPPAMCASPSKARSSECRRSGSGFRPL